MSVLAQIQPQNQSVGFKQVLIATDFSDASRRALAYAIAIARRYGSALSIVHAIPPEPREPNPLPALPRELNRRRLEAEREMENLREKPEIDELNHHMVLESGRVWDVLGSVIQREGVDLLVMGAHGRGGLKKLALGSVAEQILRLAPCPTLTVGPHVPPAGLGPVEFKRIPFATDFGASAAKAFPYALSLAQDCQAKLVLLHMVPPISVADLGPAVYGPPGPAAEKYVKWQQASLNESMRKLRKLIPPNTALAAVPEYIAGMDFLPEGILESAAAHRIELIVMGANRTSSPRMVAHIPWATAHEVICRATCPVLTCVA
jgi:nucleotide-binding universal stress UspA family protein